MQMLLKPQSKLPSLDANLILKYQNFKEKALDSIILRGVFNDR